MIIRNSIINEKIRKLYFIKNIVYTFFFVLKKLNFCRLFLRRGELDNPHKPKTWKTYQENFGVDITFARLWLKQARSQMTLSHFNLTPFFSANNIHETHYLIRDHTGGKFCNIVPFRLYLQWNVPVFKFLDHHGHYKNPPRVWFLLPVILILIRITKLAF